MLRPALALPFLLLVGCTALEGALPDDALAFLPPVAVSQEWPGAEPVIALAPDGTAYVEGIGGTASGDASEVASSPSRVAGGNVNKVWRSDDGGASWTDITPPGPGQERSNDGYVAVSTDGTLYAANVFSLTLQLFRSEDKGETWTKLAVPPVPPIVHRHWFEALGDTVHLTVEALPPSFVPYLAGAPPLPTDATDARSGMWYARSDDGGTTWTAPAQIDPNVNFAGQTNMVVSADGERIYVGRYQEDAAPPEYTYDDGHWYLLASEDGGATWERREMFDLTSETSTAVPGLALQKDGSLSMAWTQLVGNASRLVLANSTDGGRTWGAPWQPALPAGTHAMAWATAHPDGGLGVMWYEAPVDAPASQVDAAWSVRYARVTNATFESALVTPAPVHEGNICAKGPACGEGEDRSLLDYPWMDFGPDGKAWLVFPSTRWERPSAFAMVAREK